MGITGKNLCIQHLGGRILHPLEDVSMSAQRTTGSARKNMVKGVKGVGCWSAFSASFHHFPKVYIGFAHANLKKSGGLVAVDRSGREPKALASLCRGWKKNTQIYKNYNEFLGSPCIVSASQVNH